MAHNSPIGGELEASMKKSRHTDEHIIGLLQQAEAGTPTADICRKHGVSTWTFYRWRSKFAVWRYPKRKSCANSKRRTGA